MATVSEFDERHNFVTSAVFSPWWLASIRLLFAIYALITSIIVLVWDARRLAGSVGAGS